jgi:molybdopterin-guanine dinucleotide biosynthesis protein MobB
MDKAIAIVGPSGSGKTQLICRLLEWFSGQGFKVAVLKHTHKPSLGDEGKDTWHYRQAGARLVGLAAPGFLQFTRCLSEEPPLAAILPALAPEVDLILVEGYKYGPLPKVALVEPESEPWPPDYPRIIALVSPGALASALPVFQPTQAAELGLFMVKFLGFI